MEPESGLILSPEELQKYHTLCNIAYASTDIIDPDLLDRTEPDFAGTRRVTRGMSWATRMDKAGPSHPAGDDVERGEEVSSMDRWESMGIPSPHQHTSQPRGRCPPRTDIDDLINDMALCALSNRWLCRLPSIMHRWHKHSAKNLDAKLIGSTTSIHHSEPRASLGEILSPTQMNILPSTLLFFAS